MTTGRVWQGWRLPNALEDRERLAGVVDGVVAHEPDVVVAMRTSALRPEQLQRLRSHGIRTVAWFSDDPVLFKVQGRRVAELYNVTLHTAGEDVLAMYERELGVRGFAFPFWTDSLAFPRLYEPTPDQLDVVFVGNTHTRVKSWRYDWIAELEVSRAIYGRVVDDPAGIAAGEAADDAELARAIARGRLGLNISQRFSEYAGSRFDYPELAGFGEFTLPSRIVQLAAVGTPVVSLVTCPGTAEQLARLFPPVMTVRTPGELTDLVRGLRDDVPRLRALSDETFAWFARHYTADSRARFLERLLVDPDRFAGLDAARRAEVFRDVAAPRRWQRVRAYVSGRLHG